MAMIIRTKNRLCLQPSAGQDKSPVLPLRGEVLFPGSIIALPLHRSEDRKLIEHCLSGRQQLVVSFSPSASGKGSDPVIHQVGVAATIRHSSKGPSGCLMVTIEGIRRVAIDRIVGQEPFLRAKVNGLRPAPRGRTGHGPGVEAILEAAGKLSQADPAYSPEHLRTLEMSRNDPGILADRAASLFHFPLASKQELLETVDLRARLELLLSCLGLELDLAVAAGKTGGAVWSDPADRQASGSARLHYQRGRRQSGSGFAYEGDVERIKNQIENSPHLSPEVVTRATIEVDRLSQLPRASAEYGEAKSYLDLLLSLPWRKYSPENCKISDVEKILSAEYYGPVNLKERILQRLSVRILQGGVSEGPTLCLFGAPGTGKASLAKAIAHALGKEFIRISVGGISDVADIKGTPRTFLAALPGKIIRALRDVGSCDPVVLIEDIDYFNMDNDASVNMALLEAIDSRRNSRFLDNYLGVPFDLSKVFFVCSVRSFEEIPEQFIPRFEIIELPGYIENEKRLISKRYLIPSLLERHGLTKAELKFTDKALTKIITNYTQEAGLLAFSREIEKICRKIALEKLKKPKSSWVINEKNLESYLGPVLFIPERPETLPEIGIAAGLAWTGAGGELMFIEGLKMKGSGDIITTGSLGEVMKESIQAAHSYVRSKADMLGIDFSDFSEFDIHIHFPSGAIPKDGPSAGMTVCLVVASVMSERPIRNDIAITGEVTLRGRVLRVAGIKEKISAAYRTGIYHVALPKENQKDINELPKEILRRTKFTFIERVDELFEVCLLDFTPSSYTLEKVFAEEIVKAKDKKPHKIPRPPAPRTAKRK